MPRGDVATKLRECMETTGVSIRGLAKAIGKDRSHVQKWARGTVIPDPDNARLLADYFGKPADYFVTPRERRPTMAERLAALEAEVAALRRLQQGDAPE